MAAEEENNKKNEGKGFAGLSSLLSDVDTTPPPPAPKTESAGSTKSTERPASTATQPQPQQQQPQPQHQTYQEPPQPSSGSSGGKWLLGIAAVVGVLWLIGQSNKPTSSPAPAYSPPAQSAAPSYTPPAQPQAPSMPQESKPPVGQDLVLSPVQIRYCLAEDIRMEGAKATLNNYSDSDVDRFNAMVADYNSRCGSFRYRSGALERARRDVEPYRSQLQAQGRSRFARSPSRGALSAPTPARPAADETVRAVQQKLNELGYNAGQADGLIGKKTRTAIYAYQHNVGIAPTGVADAALLQKLNQTPRLSSKLDNSEYGAKLAALVKSNIIFGGRINGNPGAVIEVLTQSNGQISSSRLISSSGIEAWDQAVLRAVDRTGLLPLDKDGSIPALIHMTFRPNG